MKLIEQKVELWKQGDTLEDMWDHIAKCTRVCYQSTPKNKDESGKDFCKRTILANKHYGMLEHGTVYLTVSNSEKDIDQIANKYKKNPYSRVHTSIQTEEDDSPNTYYNKVYITTNYRVILENGWENDLQYLSPCSPFHIERKTVSIITSIGIGRELCRHRHFSFAQESTRYVNYGKNEHMEFIIPDSIILNPGIYYFDRQGNICGDGYIQPYKDKTVETTLLGYFDKAQDTYTALLEMGEKPQNARDVLPLALKTQLIMTGFEDDWSEFIDKRFYETTGKVHPGMKKLAKKIVDVL